MENIWTVVHVQRWITDKICMSLWSSWPVIQRHTGFEVMSVVWNGQLHEFGGFHQVSEICWVIGRGNGGKETKERGVGMQHLSGKSDWLWWQCNDRGFTMHSLLHVFLYAFAAWTMLLVGLLPCSPGLFKWGKQMRGIPLLCLSAQNRNMYFLWLTSCRNLIATTPLPMWSQSEAVAFTSVHVLKTVKYKCILRRVSTTWLLSLSNCSQRTRVTSPAYSIKHRWLLSLTLLKEGESYLIM